MLSLLKVVITSWLNTGNEKGILKNIKIIYFRPEFLEHFDQKDQEKAAGPEPAPAAAPQPAPVQPQPSIQEQELSKQNLQRQLQQIAGLINCAFLQRKQCLAVE